MLTERLQVLVSRDQRRRLESEAQRRGLSVGGLIREAVDAQLGHVGEAERLEALDGIRAASGRFLAPEELNRIVDGESDAVVVGRLVREGHRAIAGERDVDARRRRDWT